MIRVKKLEKGTYFDDAYMLSFRYDPSTVAKVKELAQRRYLPEERAWEIPSYELPNLIDKVGLNNIEAEDTLLGALKSKEVEDRKAAIKNGIIAELENILTSVNPLSCTLRLRQLTGGLFTEDNPKLERIKDMLAEEIIPNGYKALIFSQWEKITEVYYEALKEYNPAYIVGKVSAEDREAEKERFQNDPECKLAIGTIGAMGTGFTLNKASYVFFVDKAWNSGDNAQAEDRAHRIGTEGTVNVISLVAKGTVDEGIEEYLIDNQDLFDRVVDGKGSKHDIRQVLTNLLKL